MEEWNTGRMEWWVLKEITYFKTDRQGEFWHLPNIPIFQHSS
jgi:hypothetical protein